ncbi:hypothetical protein BC826DRAFT_1044755 [Russula brevipes]|nr:hypothetical protein BC826DRAFT_1044755 [Russula brevipes]
MRPPLVFGSLLPSCGWCSQLLCLPHITSPQEISQMDAPSRPSPVFHPFAHKSGGLSGVKQHSLSSNVAKSGRGL